MRAGDNMTISRDGLKMRAFSDSDDGNTVASNHQRNDGSKPHDAAMASPAAYAIGERRPLPRRLLQYHTDEEDSSGSKVIISAGAKITLHTCYWHG